MRHQNSGLHFFKYSIATTLNKILRKTHSTTYRMKIYSVAITYPYILVWAFYLAAKKNSTPQTNITTMQVMGHRDLFVFIVASLWFINEAFGLLTTMQFIYQHLFFFAVHIPTSVLLCSSFTIYIRLQRKVTTILQPKQFFPKSYQLGVYHGPSIEVLFQAHQPNKSRPSIF